MNGTNTTRIVHAMVYHEHENCMCCNDGTPRTGYTLVHGGLDARVGLHVHDEGLHDLVPDVFMAFSSSLSTVCAISCFTFEHAVQVHLRDGAADHVEHVRLHTKVTPPEVAAGSGEADGALKAPRELPCSIS